MNPRIWSLLGVSALVLGLSGCILAPTEIENVSEPSAANTTNSLKDLADGAQVPSVRINVDEQGRALRGYDPVAYFTEGKATQGQEEYSLVWEGTRWLFSTPEHRQQFLQNPEQYEPENGGYCTFGVVLSKKLDGDPEIWSIFDGYLYIFLNEEVREKFLQDKTGNLARVIENWPQIRDEAPSDLN